MDHDQVTVDGVRLSPISARASCFLTQRLPDILPPHGKSSGCGAAISTEICFVLSIFSLCVVLLLSSAQVQTNVQISTLVINAWLG
jgi:hypothetical protein